MKTKFLSLAFIFLFLFGFSNCKKESLNNSVNISIEGEWHINTWTKDGIPFFTSSVPVSINFIKDGKNKDTTRWEHIAQDDALFESSYEVITDGTQINFDGNIFDLRKLTDEELILHGKMNDVFWKVNAERE